VELGREKPQVYDDFVVFYEHIAWCGEKVLSVDRGGKYGDA
jgi:hypothetical protein